MLRSILDIMISIDSLKLCYKKYYFEFLRLVEYIFRTRLNPGMISIFGIISSLITIFRIIIKDLIKIKKKENKLN